MWCDAKGNSGGFSIFSGDSDDLFNPVADGDAVDDEETIDKEELIAEKVWFVSSHCFWD